MPERADLGPPMPPAPPPAAGRPLPEIRVPHSPVAEIVPTGGYLVDARVLVISADGTEPGLAAIRQTLGYLGTPHDVLVAAEAPPLTPTQLASGNHGRYNAIVLTTGNLAVTSGGSSASAFTETEWAVLATYEATFKVRRAALYAFPDLGYGFSGTASLDTTSSPLPTECTARGRAVFPYLNCRRGVLIRNAWAYPATPSDPATIPLLAGADGRVLAAIRQHPDGREALVLTFAQAPFLLHSLQLLHGVVSWASRGVFLGERHVYLGLQIDDFLLATDMYGGGTYRLTVADLEAALAWQEQKRRQPLTAGLRYDLAFNGAGAELYAPDPLAARARELAPAFGYISHTYTHADLTSATYELTGEELARNVTAASELALAPFSVANLVTPRITGLGNGEAMRAAFDAGVRYVVSDTSVPGGENPTPNAGIFNPYHPGILMIPRRPNNLFFDVSTPDEWVAEYNDVYRAFWGRNLSYDEILDRESDVLVQYLLRGENDPWMFHQADLREYARGHSLLGDLLDATLSKYAEYVEVPILVPTMEELGSRVGERMRYDASGVSATVDADRAEITVRVVNAATVPVTGVCAARSEIYAGERIAYLTLEAGASKTVPVAARPCEARP